MTPEVIQSSNQFIRLCKAPLELDVTVVHWHKPIRMVAGTTVRAAVTGNGSIPQIQQFNSAVIMSVIVI